MVRTLLDEVEMALDKHPDYRLIGMSAYQVGIGNGSYVQVILAFKLKDGK